MAGLPQNLYNIKFQDIQKGMIIYTDDTESGLGMCEFEVLEQPKIVKNIGTIQCENRVAGVLTEIKVNIAQPREIFTAKLISGWRKL